MNNLLPPQNRSTRANLYIPVETRDLLEKSVINLSARIGRRVSPSLFMRYLINKYHDQAILDIVQENADQKTLNP